MYRNIGRRIIYWRGQKVLMYDIWPKELLNFLYFDTPSQSKVPLFSLSRHSSSASIYNVNWTTLSLSTEFQITSYKS